MKTIRILFGLLTFIIIVNIFNHFSSWLKISDVTALALSGVVFFSAALLGGFIARYYFVALVFLFWLVTNSLSVWVLYKIAEPTGQASLFDILHYGLSLYSITLLACVAGAFTGQKIARKLKITMRPVAAC